MQLDDAVFAQIGYVLLPLIEILVRHKINYIIDLFIVIILLFLP